MEKGLLYVIVVGFCLALSFLFSGMEAGVLALSRWRIRQQMRAGKRRARLLHDYLENPEHFLWTILIGNTLATVTAISLIISGLHEVLGARPGLFLLSFAGIVFCFYALCDLLPKMLFRLYPNRLCLTLAVPFRFSYLGLSPLVSLMEWFSNLLLRWTGGKSFSGHIFGSRNELRMVMQESAQGLTSEERSMINRVLDLPNIPVRQITLPLNRVVAVTTQTPLAEMLHLYRQQHHTHMPVWEEKGERRIVGIVSLNSILFSSEVPRRENGGDYLKPALYFAEDLHLEEALRRMQRSGQRLAIVLARDRRELGIVTLEDVLKVIFGEVNL